MPPLRSLSLEKCSIFRGKLSISGDGESEDIHHKLCLRCALFRQVLPQFILVFTIATTSATTATMTATAALIRALAAITCGGEDGNADGGGKKC